MTDKQKDQLELIRGIREFVSDKYSGKPGALDINQLGKRPAEDSHAGHADVSEFRKSISCDINDTGDVNKLYGLMKTSLTMLKDEPRCIREAVRCVEKIRAIDSDFDISYEAALIGELSPLCEYEINVRCKKTEEE